MTITPAPDALGRTVSDWVDELLEEYLDPVDATELDSLDQSITATATTMFTTYSATGLRAQARAELDDELVHVWAPGDDAGSYVVRRGMGGSTAAAHDAGAIVRVNPRWPRSALARHLAKEIRSWPSSVGAVATGDLDVPAGAEAVDLDGLGDYEILRILAVQQDHADATDDRWPAVPARLERRQDTTAFPSGQALRFLGSTGSATTLQVSVLYRPPIPTLDFADDLGTDYHLNDRLADAALLGVAGRLLLASEIPRTDDRSQPRPRRAEDVPPGHRLQAGSGLLTQRDAILKAEAERILNEYPPRF